MWLLLRDARIRVIFFAQTIDAFGSGLSMFALAWFLRKENPALAGGILGAQGLGIFVGTIVLGAYLDRWDLRQTMVFANLISAGLVASLATLLALKAPSPLILLVAAAVGCISGLVQSALSASIPLLGGIEKTQQINALFNSTWQKGGLITPVLSGVLTATFGATMVLYFDAATFLVAAFAYATIRFPERTTDIATADQPQHSALRTWWHDVLTGYSYFVRQPLLWGTMVGVSCLNAGFASFFLFLPRVVDRLVADVPWLDRLGTDRGAVGFGFIDTVTVVFELMLSIYLTSHVLGKTNLSASRLTLVGVIAPLLGMIVIVHTKSLAVALLTAAIMGVTISFVSNVWPALFARVVPEELLGRVTSVRYAFGSIGGTITPWMSGLLLARQSVYTATTLVIGMLISLSLVGHVFASRSIIAPSR